MDIGDEAPEDVAGGGRRRLVLPGAIAMAAVIMVVAIVLSSDPNDAASPPEVTEPTVMSDVSDEVASEPSDSLGGSVTPQTSLGGGNSSGTPNTAAGDTQTDSADQAEADTADPEHVVPSPSTVPESGTPSETMEAPQPSLPHNEIPRTNEADTCNGINERLMAYRELASEGPMSGLLTLQLGLAEFEHVADFLSEGHDWGLLKVEQLTLVRRDWSTAYAAFRSGDQAVADERFGSAMEFLDAAIEVSCP